MIRVELIKMLRRPRTWITIAGLNALPTLVAILLGGSTLTAGAVAALPTRAPTAALVAPHAHAHMPT